MPRKQSESIEEMVAAEAERLRDVVAKGAADVLGPAYGTERTENDDEDLDLWDFTDQSVDPLARFTELVAQGITSSQARALVAVEQNPERLTVLEAAGDIDEKIALAERMKRRSASRAEKRRTEGSNAPALAPALPPSLATTQSEPPAPDESAPMPPTMEGMP